MVKTIKIQSAGAVSPASNTVLSISQIRALNAAGTAVMTGANVTGYRGPTLQTTSSAGYLVDGNMDPRNAATGFIWEGAKRDDYVMVTFPTEVEVSQLIYVGRRDTANVENNRGVILTLYNTAGAEVFKAATETVESKQAVYVCIPQRFVQIPATIKCTIRAYQPLPGTTAQGRQFLCANEAEAMKLFAGPTNKEERYLMDGDQVCVPKSEGSNTYSCYQPYSRALTGDYFKEEDSTKDDILQNYDVLCDTVTRNFYDLKGGMKSLEDTKGNITLVESRLIKSKNDLDALYSNYGCANVSRNMSVRDMNRCNAIKSGSEKIQTQIEKIRGVKNTIQDPVDRAVTSRGNIGTLMQQFNCPT
jgi:hypothetical protein